MKVFKMCFVAMVLFSMAMVAKAQTEEGKLLLWRKHKFKF